MTTNSTGSELPIAIEMINPPNSTRNDKFDELVLDYFIHEGYEDAAIKYSCRRKANANDIDQEIENRGNNRYDISGNKKDQISPPTSSLFIDNMNRLSNDKEFSDMVISYFNNPSGKHNNNESTDKHNNNNGGSESASFPDITDVGAINNRDKKTESGFATIKQRQEIKKLILNGDISQAIKQISQYYPMILDLNNLLHFKLLRLNLVEMIRNHKFNTKSSNDSMDAGQDEREFLATILNFVRENLINKVFNSFKLLKELEITMSLLCFKFDPTIENLQDQADLPVELKKLFDLSLRYQCYRLVNNAILKLYNNEYTDVSIATTNKDMLRSKSPFSDSYYLTNDETVQELLEDREESNKRKMTRTYHGPKFAEFDLSNYKHKSRQQQQGINYESSDFVTLEEQQRNNEQEELEAVDEEDEDDEEEEIGYHINPDVNLYSNGDADKDMKDSSIDNIGTENEDEMNRIINLSLDSRLERVIKLWLLTEQRIKDLNIVVTNRN
ncbi:hypothetical protein MG1_03721 [Candida albicans GC75]|nr:hypothetical protein MG1_03721 [Candida albicans GC75]